MIEYSIYMMGNPIKPEEPQKAYAKNQVREIWDLNKFCKHICFTQRWLQPRYGESHPVGHV